MAERFYTPPTIGQPTTIIKDMDQVFRYLVLQNQPSIDVCALLVSPEMEDPKYMAKKSKSPSEIFFSTVTNFAQNTKANVALKIWLSWLKVPEEKIDSYLALPISEKYKIFPKALIPKKVVEHVDAMLTPEQFNKFNGLEYEIAVYYFIAKNIILPGNISPNFVPFIGYGLCDLTSSNEQFFIEATKNPELRKHLIDFFAMTDAFPELKLHILMTGTTEEGVKSLNDYLKGFHSDAELKSIIFQLIYALYIMKIFKITHNDLHFENILVQELPSPRLMTFNFQSGFYVTFSTNVLVKFFDWDHASVQHLKDNGLLDEDAFMMTGTWNTSEHTDRDYYQVMCMLMSHTYELKSLVRPLLENPFYKNWHYQGEDGYLQPIRVSNPDSLKLIIEAKSDPQIKKTSDGNFLVYLKKEELSPLIMPVIRRDIFEKFIGSQRYQESSSFLVGVTKDYEKINLLPGWGCQQLHVLKKDSVLYPLEDFFIRKDLFDLLINGLDIRTDEWPDQEHVYYAPS